MALIGPEPGDIRILAERYGRTLFEQEYKYPDGKTVTFALWSSKKGAAVLVFPITKNGEIVALRQFRCGPNDFVIEIPGGHAEAEDKNKEDTARRELKDETGYVPGKIISVDVSPFVLAPHHRYRFEACIALDCEKVEESTPDPEEVLETVLIPVAEWYRKIWAGEIIDNQMIGLSLLAIPHLRDYGVRLEFSKK